MKFTRSIIFMYIAAFTFMAANMISNPIVAGYALALGAGAGAMSTITGLNSLSALCTRPFLGNWADRVDKYKFTQVGLILMAIGAALQVVAPGAAVLSAGRIILGLGFTCSSISLPAWLSSLVPENQIGRAIGLYGTTHAIGMALAPTLGIILYQTFGYRSAFIVMLALAVSAFVLLKIVRSDKSVQDPRMTEKAEQSETAASDTAGIETASEVKSTDTEIITETAEEKPAKPAKKKLQLLCMPTVPVSSIAMFLCMPYCATQAYLVQYTEMKGIVVFASLFFPTYAGFLAILRTTISKKVDKIPFKYFFYIAMVCMTIYLLGMTVMRNNVMMCVMSLFLAISYGLINTVCQSQAIILAGRGNEGIGNSTFYLGLDIGMTGGAMIGGVLISKLPVDMFFPSMLVVIPICIVIYVFFIRKQGI